MVRHIIGATVVALAGLSLGGSAPPQDSVPTRGNEGLERVLAPGAAIERPVEASVGTYLEFRVDQIRGDTAIVLLDPEGTQVAASDLPGKPWLTEIVAAVTLDAGTYTLRFEAPATQTEPSRFRVSKALARAASGADETLVAGLDEWRRAMLAKEEQTEDGMRRASRLLASAAERLEVERFPAYEGRIRRDLGDCYANLGSGEEAEREFLLAIELLESAGDTIELAEALNRRGDLLTNRGEHDLAAAIYEQALALARSSGDLGVEALTWNNLGVLYYYRGELDRVVEAFETALALQIATGAEGEQANTLTNLAATYRTLGRYADSLRASDEALALARRLDDKQREMSILNTRGIWFKAVGRIRPAIEAYQTALGLAERLGAREEEAVIAGNLGSLYRLLGQLERARGYLERGLAAAAVTGSVSEESWLLLRLGELARDTADPGAISFFLQAREKSAEAADKFSSAYSLLGLGRIYLDAENPAGAFEVLDEALAIQLEISDRPGQLATYRELGRAAAALGDAAGAQSYFGQALAMAQVVGDPYQEAATRARLAQFLARQGDLERARVEVTAALATIESLRREIAQPDLRAGLLSRSQRDFALLVDILEQLDRRYPRQGFAEKAFEVSEAGRARSLVELLALARAGLEDDLAAPIQARRTDLAGKLSQAQRSLTSALQQSEVDSRQVEVLREEIRLANRQREDLEDEIRAADSRWRTLEAPRPLDVAGAQELLEPHQVLVSYVLGEERSFAFVVSRTEFSFTVLDGEAQLESGIDDFMRLLETPSRRHLGRLRSEGAALYDRLVRPIEQALEGYSHVLVVPDGGLHRLPFEALVKDPTLESAASYLIADWAVSYAPSASTLAALGHRNGRDAGGRTRFVAFADPDFVGALPPDEVPGPITRGLARSNTWDWPRLAGAREEVASIAQRFTPREVRLFVGPEASERSFKTDPAVGEAQYLHVAAHALIDDVEPSLASLLLAPAEDGTDDGLLQTHEVFNLRLSADLVVLSGCETALGRSVRGEGFVGLTRAFLYAGALSVSVSLWPVEDVSSSLLMIDLYAELSRSPDVVEALRRAKLKQLQQGIQSHPYYWAAFVLVGRLS